jgi:hypothetical protein
MASCDSLLVTGLPVVLGLSNALGFLRSCRESGDLAFQLLDLRLEGSDLARGDSTVDHRNLAELDELLGLPELVRVDPSQKPELDPVTRDLVEDARVGLRKIQTLLLCIREGLLYRGEAGLLQADVSAVLRRSTAESLYSVRQLDLQGNFTALRFLRKP